MPPTILDLYKQFPTVFRFKGNRPNESMATRINELALVGDGVLALAVRTRLVFYGHDASQITQAFARFLSNAALAEVAVQHGILDGAGYATHASGTLLEAIVGYWYMSQFRDKTKDTIFALYKPAFDALFDTISTGADAYIKNGSVMDDLFDF